MQIHHFTAGGECVHGIPWRNGSHLSAWWDPSGTVVDTEAHRNHKPIRTGREAVEKAQAVVNRIAKGGQP